MLEEEIFAMAQDAKAPAKDDGKPAPEKKDDKVEIKPYKVYDQDFSLTDPDMISYYKTRMKMMCVKFRLVGKFNEKGLYKISNEIRYDLVEMEKEIEENGEDYYKAIALYMKKHFYFTVKIKPIDDGKAKASLYLSEYVQDFLGKEYISSHIADFVDVNDDDFRIKVRKAFNLVDVATKVDDLAVPNLAVVMQDNFDLDLLVGGLYDMASQIYLLRLLKALETCGQPGALVLARYRELLVDNDIEINEKHRYTHYKALLDRAVDELGGYDKLNLDPKIVKPIIKDMNKTVKAIDNASMAGMLEADLPDNKVEEMKASKSTSKPSKKPVKKDSAPAKEKPKKKKPKTEKKEDKNKGGGGASVDFFNKTLELVVDAILDEELLKMEQEEQVEEEKMPEEVQEENQQELLGEDDIDELGEFNNEDLQDLGVVRGEVEVEMEVKETIHENGDVEREVTITAEAEVALEGNLDKTKTPQEILINGEIELEIEQ